MPLVIGIIDCGFGNVGSIQRMLDKIGAKSSVITTRQAVSTVEKLILPGVGHFKHGMNSLKKSGIDVHLKDASASSTPLLGICLGMQLLFSHSEEGNCEGLDIINGNIIKINSSTQKVPHMGWNEVTIEKRNPLLTAHFQYSRPHRFYFVHSYHAVCNNSSNIIATFEYGIAMNAIVGKGNTFGTQFHPEKSHAFGLNLLKSFVEL